MRVSRPATARAIRPQPTGPARTQAVPRQDQEATKDPIRWRSRFRLRVFRSPSLWSATGSRSATPEPHSISFCLFSDWPAARAQDVSAVRTSGAWSTAPRVHASSRDSTRRIRLTAIRREVVEFHSPPRCDGFQFRRAAAIALVLPPKKIPRYRPSFASAHRCDWARAEPRSRFRPALRPG
jgi:hypothetical protein